MIMKYISFTLDMYKLKKNEQLSKGTWIVFLTQPIINNDRFCTPSDHLVFFLSFLFIFFLKKDICDININNVKTTRYFIDVIKIIMVSCVL